ncbi:MAG: transglycosylase SLT domain-containing protein [Deltaproteobacteria bacterium]|nr:transglycosylase SLT domain-containing protein [Deltaproteobacteria bacterium]
MARAWAWVVVPLSVLAVAAADGGPVASEAFTAARLLVREGRFEAARDKLAAAGMLEPRAEPAAHAGLVGALQAALGRPDLARVAFEKVAQRAGAPPWARAMVDLHRLEACGNDCAGIGVDLLVVERLPVAAQTRYLRALHSAGRAETTALAARVLARAPWTVKELPPSDRADLLGAVHAALATRKDGGEGQALQRWAWENLPAEPAVFPVLREVDDLALAGTLGDGPAVRHLEALLEGNANEPAAAFGTLLCRGAVVEKNRACPAIKEATLACRAAFAVGKAQRQARAYRAAEGTLAVVAARCAEQAPRARFLLGKAVAAQSGGAARAIRGFEELAKKHPEHRLADDALVTAGQLSLRVGKPARRYWQQVLDAHPAGDQAPEAAWWLAWAARLQGKGDDAAARLDAMKAGLAETAPLAWRRALYWRARVEPDEARRWALLRDVVERQPQSYEAGLARGVLTRAGRELPVFDAWRGEVTPPSPGPRDDFIDAAAWLEEAGLDEDGAWLLRESPAWSAPAGASVDGGTGPAAGLWLPWRLLELGDAPFVSRWVRLRHAAELRATPAAATRVHWRLAYPQAHTPALEDAAAAEKLPAALLYALAREESAFDARVTSWAGAIGLTQLMPATAQMEARALGLPPPSNVSLLDPALNARLGAAHLARHLREFNGSVALALAAYNAGPGNVRAWLKRMGQLPLDEFVEMIPIDETRGYVKRVMETWGIYRLVRGEGPLVLPASPTDRSVEP